LFGEILLIFSKSDEENKNEFSLQELCNIKEILSFLLDARIHFLNSIPIKNEK
jgi:hypothetical protein